MSNMKLWDSVCTTNPAHTKKVTFGRAITAIDPYRQIENATRELGAAGNGWGWEVKRVDHLPTNEVCVLISLWHGESRGRVEQWGQASLYIDKAESKKDTDCMKKATTDGITKCLSMLGFNADVFLGKFDDNKYVQQVQQEIQKKEIPDGLIDAVRRNNESVKAINQAVESGDFAYAVQCYDEISQEDNNKMWVAPKTCKEMGIPEIYSTKARKFLTEEASKYR